MTAHAPNVTLGVALFSDKFFDLFDTYTTGCKDNADIFTDYDTRAHTWEQRKQRDEVVNLAKTICKACPIRVQCLNYAEQMEAAPNTEPAGIWGGVTARERSEAKKAKNINASPALKEHRRRESINRTLDQWARIAPHGYTVVEAAVHIGVKPGTLDTILQRARRQGDPRAVLSHKAQRCADIRAKRAVA
jgi:hypothetical protein